MKWLENRRQKKAVAATQALLYRIEGRQIQYATRREPDATETVLGKGGRIWIHADEIRVSDAEKELFACRFAEVDAGELMSGDGLVLKGPNRLTGQVETVVAYYLYFR